MTCDPWQGLVAVEDGTGCAVRVQLGVAEEWEAVGLVLACIVVALLTAMLVGMVRR